MRHNKRVMAVLAVFAMLAVACGNDDTATPDSTTTTTQAATEATAMETTTTMMEETTTTMMEETTTTTEAMLPGDGVTVNMARADWATGYFQAAIYRQVLGEMPPIAIIATAATTVPKRDHAILARSHTSTLRSHPKILRSLRAATAVPR